MISIKVNQISKRYSTSEAPVLNRLTFEIAAGEKFGILGPNGAGKTTLISVICGLLEADSGQLQYWSGGKPLSYRGFKQSMAYIPQELAFYDNLTGKQNLEFFGAMYGLTHREISLRSKEILDLLGLSSAGSKKAKHYSGGMKRRLNMAAALMHQPKIVFLDEPTVGVDVQSKNAIVRFLNQLNDKGVTIIYSSHYLAEAEALCDRILLIDKGEKTAYGDLIELKTEGRVESLEELFLNLTGTEYRDDVSF